MGKNKKILHDVRSKKIGRKKRKKKTGFRTQRQIYNRVEIDTEVCIRHSPDIFSFLFNTDETVRFFNETIECLKNGGYKKKYVFDSMDVTEVTTDVIIYLIALMKNVRFNKRRLYSFHGNEPKNEEARKVYRESGFYSFVKARSRELPNNTNKMKIVSGKNNEVSEAKKMCTFVQEKFSQNKKYTQNIYTILVEMMSNVYYHAYYKDELMNPVWYMYAEYKNGKINFVFIDTGMGIAKTVRKNSLFEKAIANLGVVTDSKLIMSALNGEFRTSSGEPNRGKGLPSINDFAKSEICKEFCVISGGGCCRIDENNNWLISDLNKKIYGTIYMFSIENKEGLYGD